MGFLKKLARGVGKVVGSKIGKGIVGVLPGGSAVLNAVKVAKGIGAAIKTPRQSKSVNAAIAKLDMMPRPVIGQGTGKAITMPGGAPLRRSPAPPRRRPAPKRKKSKPMPAATLERLKKAPKKAKAKSGRTFSPAQLAAQAKFKAMVAARRKK